MIQLACRSFGICSTFLMKLVFIQESYNPTARANYVVFHSKSLGGIFINPGWTQTTCEIFQAPG